MIYSTPVPPHRFIGRRRELFDLTSLVSDNGQSCAIVGEPRIGKTSLLKYLATPAALGDEPHLILSYSSAHILGADIDEASFWARLLQPLETTPYAAAYQASMKPPFKTGNLVRLFKSIGTRGQRVVVFVDELDYLVHGRSGKDYALFAGLRSLVTDSDCAFCLVATSRDPVDHLNAIAKQHGGSPYFNILSEVHLGAFTDDELEDFLLREGATLTTDDKGFIQTLSGGYPAIVSAGLYFLRRAQEPTPELRRRTAAADLLREASQMLADVWQHWPLTIRQVFASVAVEHLEALGSRIDWPSTVGPVVDPATYLAELYLLERHGFIVAAPHTPGAYLVRPLVFLVWCAIKLRGHAQSIQEWSAWMDAEGWTSPRMRQLWQSAVRPCAAVVSTDADSLFAAHRAMASPLSRSRSSLSSMPASRPPPPASAPPQFAVTATLRQPTAALPAVPTTLRDALRARRVIPFVGAGVSMAVTTATTPTERLFPSWAGLLEMAAKRLEDDQATGDAMAVRGALTKKLPNYMEAARNAYDGLGPVWFEVLRKALDPPRNSASDASLALARAIWELGSKLIVTTNYDRVLHWTAPERDDLRFWDISAPAELVKLLRDSVEFPTIWHLHGYIANATGLILTPDGYNRLYPVSDAKGVRYTAALTSLRMLLASRTFLFVGFSFDDASFADQVRWLDETFTGSAGPHYVLVREAERDRLQSRAAGLPLVLLTYADHGAPLLALLRDLAVSAALEAT